MIEPIIWNEPNTYRNLNPFIKSSYHHPIRITLHSESLSELTSKEADAVSLLRELGNLREVTILDSQPGIFPHMEIGDALIIGRASCTIDRTSYLSFDVDSLSAICWLLPRGVTSGRPVYGRGFAS